MNYKLAMRSINRLLTILKKASIFDVITPFDIHKRSKKSRGIAIKFTKLKD